MRVAVAVLTFNRLHLLVHTLASMDARPGHPFTRVVVDGGSENADQRAFVAGLPGSYQFPEKVSVGKSQNHAIGMALGIGVDLVVFTADDYYFQPNWLERLVAFWQAAPPSIALCSLNWEPEYPWNTVLEDIQIGGERTLIRATIPGSSWSFRASDWPEIGPLEDRTGGEDHLVCTKLHAHGYRLAALDLTVHTGERESAWGNKSWERAQPLQLS